MVVLWKSSLELTWSPGTGHMLLAFLSFFLLFSLQITPPTQKKKKKLTILKPYV